MNARSSEQVENLILAWKRMPTEFAPGLSESECCEAESHYGFMFPPDLRQCLSAVLPVGRSFPNWRTGQIRGQSFSRPLLDLMLWPLEGVLFDIEHNNFWRTEFGPRPDSLADRNITVQNFLLSVPKLIPVYGHRFLPAMPCIAGNPIMSVYQTDIIYYGENLESYIAHEFGGRSHSAMDLSKIRRIEFWSDIIDDKS